MGVNAGDLGDALVHSDEVVEVESVAGRSPTRIAFDRLRKDKVALVCTIVILVMVLMALCPSGLLGLADRLTKPAAKGAAETRLARPDAAVQSEGAR